MASSESPSMIGKYQVTGVLGRGAMGVVYKAIDPEIGRTVAVKTLRKLASAPGQDAHALFERFKLEARTAGALRHPNLITIFEVTSVDDTPFIVMEYVEGEGLDSVIQKLGRIPPAQAIAYLSQAAKGIDHAHARGVVHRDIKPSNLLVDAHGTVFIVDFGVATMTSATSPSSSTVVGSPGYMSPEQIVNEPITRAVDLWALAVVTFEALTGRRPFAGDTFTAVVGQILNGTRCAVSAVAPDLPLALEAEFERAFHREVDKRFPSATEMINNIAKALGVAPQTGAIDPSLLPVERKRVSSEWRSFAKLRRSGARNDSEPDRTPILASWDGTKESAPPVPQTRASGRVAGPPQPPVQSVADVVRFRAQRSWMRYGTVALGVMCVVISVVIAVTVVVQPNGDTAQPARQAPATGLIGGGVAPAHSNSIEQLVAPDVDPVPVGKTVSEMSNRELLGALVGASSLPEALVIDALHEAELRRAPGLLNTLVVLLKNDSSVVRKEAIRAASDLADRRAVPYLLPALDDHDATVRRAVAQALGKLADRRALGYLTARQLSEDSPATKVAIEKAIEAITGVPVR